MYISESLLSNSLNTSDTSSIFATLLLEHLISKMEEMGSGNAERSNLYLKLFKQVFDTVNQYSIESEQTLQPYLNQIVNRRVFRICVLFIMSYILFKILIIF